MTRPPTPSSSQPVHFAPKDRPLRRDVGRLGALLGELLRELAPAGVYETVEAARLAARRRRRGDGSAGAELEASLAALAPDEALEVVRAFSEYFGVVNIAEQVHRLRRGMDYLRAGGAQPASLRAVVRELAAAGVSVDALNDALGRVLVEPVFTAHPTEARRRTLLKKEQRLARLLVESFGEEHLDPVSRATLERRVALEIASGWQTDEQLPQRPSVAEEVEHVLFFLSEVLYKIVPALHEELRRDLDESYGDAARLERPVVRFASWVGGDMDGNPNVGADTIRATLKRHVELALRCYGDDLRQLHEHLSQSASRVSVDEAVLARLAHYARRQPEDEARIPAPYGDMPYRRLLWHMEARLVRKAAGREHGYEGPEAFAADLDLLAESLRRNGGARAGLALVERVRWRVDVFGFHLAALDVRQDAQVHREAVGVLLGDADFAERPGAERTERLAAALRASSPPEAPADEALQRSLDVFVALAEQRRLHGPRAVGTFIISMAAGPDDALAVLLLARAAGCVDANGQVPLDVTPLFETVDDLAAGPDVLAALCADATYAEHLRARGSRQLVMLGYSDSNKDGGIAAARLGLERAQERLVAVARGLGVTLTLFHGRGGSVSRGGSKPRDAILSAPDGAVAGHVRTTEQGEVIGAKFGLRGIAVRSLEVSVGALLERTVGATRPVPVDDAGRAVVDTLARASRERYRALVHDEPDFPALFQEMTPLDVIERLEIGSRPARRREMRGVADLRAIPWVFAWTQCRAVLPGWFGVGSGLAAAVDEHGLAAVRRAAGRHTHLDVLLSEVEMVLAKSDLDIAARYADLAGDVGARLFPQLVEEHGRCVAWLLELREEDELLAREPTLQRSIRLRNPYVDPMSFLQVDLLRRWRAGGREDKELERALAQTVRGIARGLRNTG